MKKSLLGAILVALASSLNAGTAIFTGHGTSEPRKPDYVDVRIAVKTECAMDSMTANEENNCAVITIQKILSELGEGNAVSTSPGYTTAFSRTTGSYPNETVTCLNTWQQTTMITFTVNKNNLEKFSSIYASLQRKVLATHKKEEMGKNVMMTFAEIYEPQAGVCADTMAIMQNEAEMAAGKDADRQMWNQAQRCCIQMQDIKCFELDSTNQSQYPKPMYDKSFSARDNEVAINFKPIKASASITNKYSFPDSVLCYK